MKLVFALSVAGAVPVTMLPLTDIVTSLVLPEPGAHVPPLLRLAVNAALLGVTLLLALLMPNVELVFALAGSTGAVMQAYIFPCAAFVAAHRPEAAPAAEAEGLPPAGKADAAAQADLWTSQEVADAAAARAGNAAAADMVEAELFGPMRGRPASVASWGLLAAGMGAMWICTSSALRAVADEAAVVSLAQHIAALDEATTHAKRSNGTADAAPRARQPAANTAGLFEVGLQRVNVTALNLTAEVLAGNSSVWRADASSPALLTRAKVLAAELEEQDREKLELPVVSR